MRIIKAIGVAALTLFISLLVLGSLAVLAWNGRHVISLNFEDLRYWQTAISGLIGFIGLIITLSVGDYLSRSLVADTQRHQTDTIRKALSSEIDIVINRLTYIQRTVRENWENNSGSASRVPTSIPVLFWHAYASRLGELDNDEMDKLIDFYTVVEGYGTLAVELSDDRERNNAPGTLIIYSDYSVYFIEVLDTMINTCTIAKSAIKLHNHSSSKPPKRHLPRLSRNKRSA